MIVALLLRSIAGLSILGGIALGKANLGLIGAVPWAMRLFWMDGQLLIAGLVFPTVNIGLGGSIWATPYKLMLGLAVLRTTWNARRGQRLRAPPLGIAAAYSLLMVYALLLEMTSGSDPFLTVFTDGVSCLLMLSLMAQLVRGTGALESLYKLVSFATLLQFGAVAVEMTSHGGLLRSRGLSGQSNLLGVSVGTMIPICLCAALSSPERKTRWLNGAAFLGGIYAVMASGSRGGTVAALVGMAVVVLLSSRSILNLVLRVVIGATLLVAVTPFAPPMYEKRILNSVVEQPGSNRDITSGRAEQMSEIVELVQTQSVFGIGMGTYLAHISRTQIGKPHVPHSSVMGIAVAWGIFTAAAWIGVQLSGVFAAIKLRSRLGSNSWLANGLIGALLSSFFSSLSSPAYFSAGLWALVFFSHVLLHTTPRLAGRPPVTDDISPRPRARGPAKTWQSPAPVPTTQPL